LFKTAIDVMKLWFILVVRRDHQRADAAAGTHPAAPPGDRV
jgi:hypothetical protein